MIVRFGSAAEDREVLGRLVARAIAGREPGQGADDLDVEIFLGDRHADEVIGAARGEHGIGGGKGHEAFARHAGGGAHQQLLGHAHLVEAVRIGLREDVEVGVFGKIGAHADDVGPRLRQPRPARGRKAPCASADRRRRSRRSWRRS